MIQLWMLLKHKAMDTKIYSHILLQLIVILFSPLSVTAQVKVSGTITESNGQPLPYTSVQFMFAEDTAFTVGTLSEPDGRFSVELKNGNYLLRISSLGFKPYNSEVSVPAGVTEFGLDTVQLTEEINTLDAVIVRANRPLYEKKSDGISINVAGIAGSGSTVLEILSKSPGVLVNRQSGNIEINGKKGILLLIDGKVNRLPPEALIPILDGMNSENIDKIEIVTSPPAKYDASGDAGIINIILKSGHDKGLNGNVSVTTGYQRGAVYGTNIRIQQKESKLNTFLNYSFRSVKTIHYWKFNSDFIMNNITVSDRNESKRKPLTGLHDLKLGLEYKITRTTRAALFLSGYRRNWDLKAVTASKLISDTRLIEETDMAVREINKWQSATANLELNQKLGNSQKLALSFDYLYYINNNPSSYRDIQNEDSQSDHDRLLMEVKKHTPIYYKVGSIDYSYQPGSNLVMEAGIKGAFSEFHNDVSVIKYDNEPNPVDNTTFSDLDEKILAVYYSSEWNMNPKLHFLTGLRYEYTKAKLNVEQQGINRIFGEFFPSLSVTYEMNERKKLRLSYNRRITRPTFNDMAAFVFYVGPRTYFSGNLNLKPAVTDAFDLSWNIKQLWLSVKYGNTKNEISQFQPERDTITNEVILRARNVDYLKALSVQAVFPIKISRWWTVQNDYSLNFFVLSDTENEFHFNENLNAVTAKMVHSLNVSDMIKAEAAFSYQSGSFMGISEYKSSGFINLGLKKAFKNGPVLSIMANDLFNTTRWRITTSSDNLDYGSRWSYDWGGRSITMSFSFPFGNNSLSDREIKPRSEAERSRVN